MTKHPFLLDNLRALEDMNAPIIGWLSKQRIDMEALDKNLIRNHWDMIDWAMPSGKGIFDAIPPLPHYKTWIPQDKPDTSATIIVGSNIGYGVNQVVANTPNSHKVLLLEPRPELLLACLGQTDYRPFFKMKKLHLLVPDGQYLEGTVRGLDLHYIYGNIFLKTDVPSQQLGPEYAMWSNVLREELENFSVELNTLRLKQDTMVGNEIKNFGRAMSDGSLNPLQGAARGLSAVILGAGPSLKQFAPTLAEHRGYAVYATALQTLPALQTLGLKPDFCLAIDFTKSILQVYDRLDLEWAKDIPLIYSTKMDPEVIERYSGPTIPLWTLGGIATYVMQGRELVLDAGGNVGVTLNRFFHWAGADRILLAGQDFAWRGEVSHIEGHHSSNNYLTHSPLHMETQDADGNTIFTTLQLQTARRDLEKDLSESSIPVYNLYGGGAPIRFSRPATLDDVFSKGLLASVPGSLEAFKQALATAMRPAQRPVFEYRSVHWTNTLRGETKALEKLFKKIDKHQQDIHDRFGRIHAMIKADQLYMPYLFNELMDLAGLLHARQSYCLKDLGEFKKLSKRILAKIREMDQYLAVDRKIQAA